MINPKGKFQEALKLFDNREYRPAKKACDKILEKHPTNEEALALKGLSVYYLNEKDEGKKLINQALKLNLKSPIAWHFYSLLHKEEGNHHQALKCYLQAYKNDPNNYNVIRDLSYLQLYLKQYNSFLEYSKKAVECKSGMFVNWVTYSFAHTLLGNYTVASNLAEITLKTAADSLKKNEKHEIIMFSAMNKYKAGNYKEAIKYLIEKKDDIIDKTLLYENIIKNALKCKDIEIGIQYCKLALDINCENVNYIIWYFTLQINKEDFKIQAYNDLLSIEESNKYLSNLLNIISNELKPKYPKGKLIARLELAFSTGDKFKELFTNYFLNNVKITIPSFFINVKFIYLYQKYKLPIIENILNEYLTCIEKNKKVNDQLDNEANMAWVHYYASQHYDFLGESEKALTYINKALDSTPSVVEFYMEKSKILKHGYMLEESALTYEKAKTLDLGDRYLNAKYAKIFTRMANVDKSVEIMKEFVKDPLGEENVEYYQCMWHEMECGNAYLQNGKILHAHFLFKSLLKHFSDMVGDQSDFYNFCLRRYMMNDLYYTISYFNKITDNKYVYFGLTKLDLIYSLLSAGKCDDTQLLNEFEEMKNDFIIKKYKFSNVNELKKDIEYDFYSILKLLQNLSNREDVHFYCVKYFLIKKKIVMALKSLKLLSKNKKGFFYNISMKLFKEYYDSNKDTFNEAYLTHVNELMQNYDGKNEWEENDKINYVLYKLYSEAKFRDGKHNQNLLSDLLNSGDKLYFRTLKNEKINEIISWISLFVNSNKEKEEFITKLRNKMKLDIAKEEVERNNTFYEDKKVY